MLKIIPKRILLLFFFLFSSGHLHSEWNWEYDMWVEHLSKKYNISVSLVKGVIKAESGFKNNSISPQGAIGYMQLMPETAVSLGIKDIYDPVENLKGGIKYLKILLDKYKNIPLALAAYNAGPGAVNKYGCIPPYPETINFVFTVLKYCDYYDKNRRSTKNLIFKNK
jgi:soluble lytic murein transglycosylase-like protein